LDIKPGKNKTKISEETIEDAIKDGLDNTENPDGLEDLSSKEEEEINDSLKMDKEAFENYDSIKIQGFDDIQQYSSYP
jgi:hypothetical protein